MMEITKRQTKETDISIGLSPLLLFGSHVGAIVTPCWLERENRR